MGRHYFFSVLFIGFLLSPLVANADAATVVNILNLSQHAARPIGQKGIKRIIPPKRCMEVGFSHFPVNIGFTAPPFKQPKKVSFSIEDPDIRCSSGKLFYVKNHKYCITRKTVAGVYLLDIIILNDKVAFLRNAKANCPTDPVPWFLGI